MIDYFRQVAEQFANPVTAVAQLLGFVPLLLNWFIFRPHSRNTSIAIKAVSDGFSALHFLLLREWTGCAINCVNIGRGVCFAQRGKRTWASGVYLPVLFCILTVASSALSWMGPESLLPMAGTCFGVIGYWCREPAHLRRFVLCGVSLWLIYAVITVSVPTVVGNLISITSIILTELRTVRKNKEAVS